jgi:YggT family protein
MQQALIFIVGTISQLYLFVVLLRLWLPWLRADFRNPIAQGILRLTSPLVIPVRRIVPPVGRLDTATVIVAFVLQYLTILVILLISGSMAGIVPIAITAFLDLVILSCRLFTFAIFIHIILSWVAPGTYNPATVFIAMLVEPVLRPFRRIVPSLGGLDISPIFAIILLQAVSIILNTELRPLPI